VGALGGFMSIITSVAREHTLAYVLEDVGSDHVEVGQVYMILLNDAGQRSARKHGISAGIKKQFAQVLEVHNSFVTISLFRGGSYTEKMFYYSFGWNQGPDGWEYNGEPIWTTPFTIKRTSSYEWKKIVLPIVPPIWQFKDDGISTVGFGAPLSLYGPYAHHSELLPLTPVRFDGFGIQLNQDYLPSIFPKFVRRIIDRLQEVITPSTDLHSFYLSVVAEVRDWANTQPASLDADKIRRMFFDIVTVFHYGPIDSRHWGSEVQAKLSEYVGDSLRGSGLLLKQAISPTLTMGGLSMDMVAFDLFPLVQDGTFLKLYGHDADTSEDIIPVRNGYVEAISSNQYAGVRAVVSGDRTQIEAVFPEGVCAVCGGPMVTVAGNNRPILVLSTENGQQQVVVAHFECVKGEYLPERIGAIGPLSLDGGNAIIQHMKESTLYAMPDITISDQVRHLYHDLVELPAALVTRTFVQENSHTCVRCHNVLIEGDDNMYRITLKDGTVQHICHVCRKGFDMGGRHTSPARNQPTYIREKEELETEPCYGIELEVELRRDLPENTKPIDYHIAAVATLKDLMNNLGIWAESDGSLTDGIEFVFQPRTVKSWVKALPKLKEFCNTLTNYHFLGHDSPHAGLHIHSAYYKHAMGYVSWTDPSAPIIGNIQASVNVAILQTYLILLGTLRDWLWVSRRKLDMISQWSSILDIPSRVMRKDTDMNFTKRGAICIGSAATTVEYRMFRSTLKPETIVATIGLVQALEKAVILNHQEFWTQYDSARKICFEGNMLRSSLVGYLDGDTTSIDINSVIDDLKEIDHDRKESSLFNWRSVGHNYLESSSPETVWIMANNDELEQQGFVVPTLKAAQIALPDIIPENSMRLIEVLKPYIQEDVAPFITDYVQSLLLKYGKTIASSYVEVA
jgi:RNase P subunit RPR2